MATRPPKGGRLDETPVRRRTDVSSGEERSPGTPLGSDLKPANLNPGAVEMNNLPDWARTALGLSRAQVPSLLRVPTIVPVAEMYRPTYVVLRPVDPQVGLATLSITVPKGELWELLSLGFLLTTDANVANREVQVALDFSPTPGGTVFRYYNAGANFSHVAATAVFYSFAPTGVAGDTTTVAGNKSILIPAPFGLQLPAGHRLRTFISNVQVGDATTLAVLSFKRFTF